MANKDAPFGLRPVRMMGGEPYSGGQSRYRIASGATTPIYQGDLVTQLTAGVLGRHAATGTVPIVGVFNGCSYTDPTSGEQVFKNYYPGSISASDIVALPIVNCVVKVGLAKVLFVSVSVPVNVAKLSLCNALLNSATEPVTVLEPQSIVLFVKVSVVALPTKVSVATGKVTVTSPVGFPGDNVNS